MYYFYLVWNQCILLGGVKVYMCVNCSCGIRMCGVFVDEDSPYKVDIFEDWLYITTYKSHNIIKIHKFESKKHHYWLAKGLSRIGDIIIVQQNKHKDWSKSKSTVQLHVLLMVVK